MTAHKMNWAERIARAEKKGKFNIGDNKTANDWPTCAVGERNIWYPPYNSEAYRLGHQFNDAVIANDVARAKKIYEQIQKLKA